MLAQDWGRSHEDDRWFFLSAGIAMALLLGLSLALWFGADRVAGWMTRSKRSEGSPATAAGADLHARAFSVFGAFLLVSAGTFLVGFLVTENLRGDESWSLGPYHIGTVVAVAVKLALGLLFFFRSDAIVSYWRSWRPAQPSSTDATDSHSR
jgi:hypothetical protein